MENTATLSPSELLRAAAELFPPVPEREYQGGGHWEEYLVENPTRKALLARATELENSV